MNRSAIARILDIHERLIRGECMTSVSIARKWECSERTIKRDIEFMRDRMRLPIGWDGGNRTLVYTDKIYGDYFRIETLRHYLERTEC